MSEIHPPDAVGRPRACPALLALLAALLAALGACSEPPPRDAVAEIADRWVTQDRFELYLERAAGDDAGDLPSEVLSKILDRFLEEELLIRMAEERGISTATEPRRRIIERLLRETGDAEPSAEAVEAYYRQHLEDYERPERVRLRQILVEEREVVERALEELRSGASFAEVARRYSRDSMGESGGVQGELGRQDLPPMFAQTIFALEPGEVSSAVEAEYGFHVFQVIERLPAEVLPLEAVEDEIRRLLREQAADERLDRLVDEARNRYPVDVYVRNLPFEYRGKFLPGETS